MKNVFLFSGFFYYVCDKITCMFSHFMLSQNVIDLISRVELFPSCLVDKKIYY